MRKKLKPVRGIGQLSEKMSFSGIIRSTLYTLILASFITGCTKEEANILPVADQLQAAGIDEIFPANRTDSVAINPVITVTFKNGTDPSTLSSSTITLKNGTTVINGTTEVTGTTAAFTPETDLIPDNEYSATIKSGTKGGSDGAREYSWTFKTGRHHSDYNLSVVSAFPSNNAKLVDLAVQPIVTFNKVLTLSMKNSMKITLSYGSTAVDGEVVFLNNTASFKPTSDLFPNMIYTGRVITVSKEGDDDTNVIFKWSFTTATGDEADLTSPAVTSVIPTINATAVPVSSNVIVNFSEAMLPSTINATSFTVRSGAVAVPGTVAFSGTKATFTPAAALTANTVYTGTITNYAKDLAGNPLAVNYSWSFTTAPVVVIDVVAPTVISVLPAGNATSVSVGSNATITFSEAMNPSTITASTFTLKIGTMAVPGTVTYSGTTATFTPSLSLVPSTVYTATISTGARDMAGNAIAANYNWSFTTTAIATDVVAPTVVSVSPVNSSVAVPVTSKQTVTFSEAMNPATITSATFTVKQGATSIAGTVTYSGSSATFTPGSALANNTVYTASVSTGAKDVAGNAIAAIYSWSFTTVAMLDVTPPAMISSTPLNGATSVAVSSKVTCVFSEAMNTTTINTASFIVMQGSSSVAGTVSYSGTTATFTPSAALAGNTLYTATVTTAATDLAGNSLTSNATWSFTTVAPTPPPVVGMSFAGDVVPVLNQCNACHTHPWTTSPVASTFYTNLVSAGYVNPTSYTASKIYTKLSSGHPGSSIPAADITKILTWMSEGSKNN